MAEIKYIPVSKLWKHPDNPRKDLGDGKSEGYFRSYWNSYTMKHEENEKLDRIYALLVKLGYEMSDDEKALQDGTHELFGEATGE